MLRAPSIQSQYDLYFSGDDCFVQPAANVSDEEVAAYVKRWEVARETGDPTELLAPGRSLAEATKFVMRQIPGTIGRALFDLYAGKRLGFTSLIAISFRLALVEIVNGPGKATHGANEDSNLAALGKMAAADVVDRLDAISPNVVTELGLLVWNRTRAISPK